jgi:L-asparagine transporter-like permease
MSVIPLGSDSPNQSPFVSVISLTGLPGAATIVGIVEISAFISSCNSGLYAASRMLYGLASTEQAPQLLQRVSRHDIPSLAIYITSLCVIAGALLNYFILNTIFHHALTATFWLILWAWTSILLSH